MADYARGELLRELREARHESQEYVAHELGVTTKTVRVWEGGGKIRWANAKKVGKYYGRDPEELVSREIPDTPDLMGSPNGNSTQLDRIEARLDALLKHFQIAWPEPEIPGEDLQRALDDDDEQDEPPQRDTA